MLDDVDRGDEGERRRDDLIARPDPGADQRGVQRRGTGAQRQGAGRAEPIGEGSLELAGLGARGDPAGTQRVNDLVDFLVADQWR
jgi:hypothetical protein